jgi:hypothetical protein
MVPSALPDGARQISQLHERFESSSAAKSTTKCVRFRTCEALVAWGIVRAKTGGGCQPWRRINGYDAESPKFRAWPLGVATLSAVFSSPHLIATFVSAEKIAAGAAKLISRNFHFCTGTHQTVVG